MSVSEAPQPRTRVRVAQAVGIFGVLVIALAVLGASLDLPARAIAIFIGANVVVFAVVVAFGSWSLNRVEHHRQQVTEDLRRSEELFSQAFHSNPAAMVLLRMSDVSYVDVNDAWLTLTGYERQEVIGKTTADVGLSTAVRRAEAIEQLKNPEGFRDMEFVITNRQGAVRQLLISSQSVNIGGEAHSLAVLIDITDRLKAEDERARLEGQLRQSQKLQALGTLAAGIAHDFNNILTVVVGNSKMARSDLPADHELQESLQHVYEAGVRGADLVRRILTFSRKQEAKRKVVKLQDVIDEGLKLLRSVIPSTIEIKVTVGDAIPEVSADATQVHQVILNLGTNAAHAIGSAGGRVDVHLTTTTVTQEVAESSPGLREGAYAVLTIADNGVGMDAEVLRQIFDPFFTTKGAGEGTGLGLAVVHGIMENHDGAITVYSEPGRGTTFRLWFPTTSEGPSGPDALARREVRGAGEHVLYVDDESALIFLITRQLVKLGYRVTGSQDPVQALQMFRSRPAEFDAVVTDLSMPGMSGMELSRRLLEIRPGVPIVIVSGYVRDEDVVEAKAMGVADMILKPNTVDELGRILHRVLRAGGK